MRKLGLNFLALIFAIPTITLCAQSVDRPNPWFTLSITEKDLTTNGSAFPEDHILLVTYTNISDAVHSDWADGVDPANMLNMVVLRDGVPTDATKEVQKLKDYREARRTGHTKSGRPLVMDVHGPIKPLKPGESVTVPLYISGYFDMSKPGAYTITVSRETFPWEPAKSVTVWSNTLTIVVPEPGAGAPE